MNRNRYRRTTAFTLVEIMIVVAIIALLAAIAVPGFLRARKRAQATNCLNDVKVVDDAQAQYAMDYNCKGDAGLPNVRVLMPYLKTGSRMYNSLKDSNTIVDSMGNPYIGHNYDRTIGINPATIALFTDVIDNPASFWGAYYNP